MKKESTVKEWSDFTNTVLGFLGKFILLPLVVLGGLISVSWNGLIGILMMFGACFLFLLTALVLVVLKPFLIKKYPEEHEDKYRIDITTPYEELSPFQKIAVDHCDGDLVAAYIYMTENLDVETQRAYTENLSAEEAMACVCAMDRIIERKHLEKEFEDNIDLEYMLAFLDMSEEQILSAKKNPFVPKLWRWLGGLLVVSVAVGLAAGFGKYIFDDSGVETAIILMGCGTTFFVYKVVALLTRSIRFRKAKRILQKQKE